MPPALLVGIVAALGAATVAAAEQSRESGRAANVHLLEEMTSPQVDALNRERTLGHPAGRDDRAARSTPARRADTLAARYETEAVAAEVGRTLAD